MRGKEVEKEKDNTAMMILRQLAGSLLLKCSLRTPRIGGTYLRRSPLMSSSSAYEQSRRLALHSLLRYFELPLPLFLLRLPVYLEADEESVAREKAAGDARQLMMRAMIPTIPKTGCMITLGWNSWVPRG
jgi:hypothetical protein